MTRTVRPRSVMALPITNIAIPTTLILLVLLVGGVIAGGALFVIGYLLRKFVWDRDSA